MHKPFSHRHVTEQGTYLIYKSVLYNKLSLLSFAIAPDIHQQIVQAFSLSGCVINQYHKMDDFINKLMSQR